MKTGSSETLIGWKSGKTTYVPLSDWMKGARCGLRVVTEMYHYLKPAAGLLQAYLRCTQRWAALFFSESAIRYSAFFLSALTLVRYQPDCGLKR
jgi:hypothetical protein